MKFKVWLKCEGDKCSREVEAHTPAEAAELFCANMYYGGDRTIFDDDVMVQTPEGKIKSYCMEQGMTFEAYDNDAGAEYASEN